MKAWQQQLNDWGYKDANGDSLKEDGIQGPKTDAATSEFENGFFDGYTGGTSPKKTVPKQTFPSMPKMNDAQILLSAGVTDPEATQRDENGNWIQVARKGTWGGSTITKPEDGQLNPDGTWKQIAKPGTWNGSDGGTATTSASQAGQPGPSGESFSAEQQDRLNTKQKIIEANGLDYTANADTRKAVASAIGLSPNASVLEVTNALQTYLAQRGDQLSQDGYVLTAKNLDTIFGAGTGDASKAGQAANYVPRVTEYLDEAKKAGVTSGFNGSGLMQSEMEKPPDISGIGAYGLYDHTTMDRNATQDAQNTYRKALEYLKQKQATDTLALNEALPKYEQAKSAGAPDVNDWQNKYMDAQTAVYGDQQQLYEMRGLLNLVEKNQQLAQQGNLQYNPDYETVAQQGTDKASGGKDAYIAQKSVPFDADNMKYFFMTPDERKNYFYIQSKQGQAVADQYMNDLNSSLVKRIAEAFSENPDANPVAYGLEAIAGGTGSWITDLMQTGSNLMGNSNFIDPNVYELTARLAQAKAKDETLRNVLDGLYTAGQLAPDVASMFIPVLGEGKAAESLANLATKLGDMNRINKGGKILKDAEKVLGKAEDVANSAEKSIIDTRKISGALDSQSKAAARHADIYYNAVRKMKTDVLHIAQNTGIDENTVAAIKQYVFMDKHELSTGFEHFAPDYEMAQSWQRLIQGGKAIKEQDIVLLQHEKMEMELMQKGYTQDEAHILASKQYDYRRYLEE